MKNKRTSKLNKMQIEYCERRIASIVSRRKEELQKKFLLEEGKILSDVEKVEYVKKRVKLPIRYRYDVLSAFDFSSLDTPAVYDEERLNVAITALQDEAEAVRARLILGSASEALAMLESFDAGR